MSPTGSNSQGRIGVVMISFGEPAQPTEEEVVPFLRRIFFQNAALEQGDAEARRKRSQQLAQERAPGLIEEYKQIGGSPLTAQANRHAEQVQTILQSRGRDARVYSAFQFTAPLVREQVERAIADGCTTLVALPVYPLCGPSTTVAALDEFARAVEKSGFQGESYEIGGWHGHPAFAEIWIHGIRDSVSGTRFSIDSMTKPDSETALLFSVHGTPISYLEQGSRYDRYVDETCQAVAAGLGLTSYYLGFQNHTNRPIAWTKPDVEDVLPEITREHKRVVVVPIAFLHEQSETLSELDIELKDEARRVGLDFLRVPVPQDAQELPEMFADLVLSRIGTYPGAAGGRGRTDPSTAESRAETTEKATCTVEWRQCVCRGAGGIARCTNGLRLHSRIEVAH